MRRWRVHKVFGTCRVVCVDADLFEIRDGALLFWQESGEDAPVLVMGYPHGGWRSLAEVRP